jgi:hypothetical protein
MHELVPVARFRTGPVRSPTRSHCGPLTVKLQRLPRPALIARLQRRFFARTEHGGAHYKYWYHLTEDVRTAYAYSKGEAYNLLKALARRYDLQIEWNESSVTRRSMQRQGLQGASR